jgi:RNA polymerase sigma-70 factor (ECF subfamily)
MTRDALERAFAAVRLKLYRYCARMTGSAVDGEDVAQDALLKALEAAERKNHIADPEAWLFRIARNTAIDFLRRRARQDELFVQEGPVADRIGVLPDMFDDLPQQQATAASLRQFMRLQVAQRSSVILMDVLGYSLREVAQIMESTVPAVKANLHRGRERLRELVQQPEDMPLPALSERDLTLLEAYIERFNARDFDAVRQMIADDAQVDLVGRTYLRGRSGVGRYFGNYDSVTDWHLSLGFVERRPAVLVARPSDPSGAIAHFMLVTFESGKIAKIRDYRYACHVTSEAQIVPSKGERHLPAKETPRTRSVIESRSPLSPSGAARFISGR